VIVRKYAERILGTEPKGASQLHTLKQARYFFLSIAALLLSACFPAVEKQLIIFSLITGAKWIVGNRVNKVNIIIKGGD